MSEARREMGSSSSYLEAANPSCPRLSRASTPRRVKRFYGKGMALWHFTIAQRNGVDGRDEPGHDAGESSTE